MQTISLPYHFADEASQGLVAGWRLGQSRVIRSAYADAGEHDEKSLRNAMKARFPCAPGFGIDAWLLHCGVRDGLALRAAQPGGRIVFGGRDQLERRRKGLISNEEWKAKRLRPLVSLGDKQYTGNRHFRLSADARTCVVTVYGRSATLHLPEARGKWDVLLRAVARLAALKEINVTFRARRTLDVTFDEMDLRRLPDGLTLQAVKDGDLAAKGRKSRGRPRGADYTPPSNPWTPDDPRPVHPEWREPVPAVAGRCVGIDLNPAWIGITAVENRRDVLRHSLTRVLDHMLLGMDAPLDTTNEVVREMLAKACNRAITMARSVGASCIAVEDGLGHLRGGGRGKATSRLLNGWARRVFLDMLGRRAALAGITVRRVRAAYSTTCGNMGFALPYACASAAELARRGLAALAGTKDILPAWERVVALDLWKDRSLPQGDVCLREASGWVDVHRKLKAAKLGVRRPHPGASPPGSDVRTSCGRAVVRLGHRGRPGVVYLLAGAGNSSSRRVGRCGSTSYDE